MAKALINPRKKHLDAICTKIATFLASETYTDELDLQKKLSDAIQQIDEVSAACVVNAEKPQAQE